MKTYSAKWKRVGRFRLLEKAKNLIAHSYDKDQNKMLLFFENGSIREIADWTNCEFFLGTDWVLWTKDQMEKEANQPVRLNVTAK